MFRRSLWFCLFLVLIASCSPPGTIPGNRRILKVAAASDLISVLPEIVDAFQQSHPGIEIRVTYGSSGNLQAQLSNRAPFDVFLSADLDYPRQLIEQGLASENQLFRYAVGRLVVWVPHRVQVEGELDGRVLLNDSIQRIALANPRHAPYGRAAEGALRALGIWDQVQLKLVFGENIAQTAQFVQTGSADAGLISLSLAGTKEFQEQGRYWIVPADRHAPLIQAGLILSWAVDQDAAENFRRFLLGDLGKKLLRQHGFGLPGD